MHYLGGHGGQGGHNDVSCVPNTTYDVRKVVTESADKNHAGGQLRLTCREIKKRRSVETGAAAVCGSYNPGSVAYRSVFKFLILTGISPMYFLNFSTEYTISTTAHFWCVVARFGVYVIFSSSSSEFAR